MTSDGLRSLSGVVGASLLLGAADVTGWSPAERALARDATTSGVDVAALRTSIEAGEDPLGEAFCRLRGSAQRRPLGQTYTPKVVVDAQIDWLAAEAEPARVIDGGTGSGRYLVAAAARWPRAQLIGADVDPVATLMARANLAARGLAGRARIELTDYRDLRPDRIDAVTAYPGNPPYVRHHQITTDRKAWLIDQAHGRGLRGSALAGLHVHFFVATALHASPGDVGAFITAAEWLDTNYGSMVRDLLLGDLGGRSLHLMDADSLPFVSTATTGVVTTFRIGSSVPSMRLQRVSTAADLGGLTGGHVVSRSDLTHARRWSPLTHQSRSSGSSGGSARGVGSGHLAAGHVGRTPPDDLVELGELCRVHRGTATGANAVWVHDRVTTDLPAILQRPTVTHARELFAAQPVLVDPTPLRRLVDLPVDLDDLDELALTQVRAWLAHPDREAARHGYLATHRRAWWSVGVRAAAPVLATYMARRPPAFVRNLASARHLNIAHGLYPRDPLSPAQLDALAAWLRSGTGLEHGRTYAGGLVKFEPREMERLLVPTPQALEELARHDCAT